MSFVEDTLRLQEKEIEKLRQENAELKKKLAESNVLSKVNSESFGKLKKAFDIMSEKLVAVRSDYNACSKALMSMTKDKITLKHKLDSIRYLDKDKVKEIILSRDYESEMVDAICSLAIVDKEKIVAELERYPDYNGYGYMRGTEMDVDDLADNIIKAIKGGE